MSVKILILIIIGGIFALGWLPLLIAGIISLFKKRITPGLIMTILGGIWGFFALISIFFALIGFAAYREADKRANVEKFDPKNYQGETGTVQFEGWQGDATLTIRSSANKNYKLNSNNGSFTAPTGNFSINSINLEAKDKKNKVWNAYINPGTWQKPYKVDIKKDIPVKINTGTPFKAKISATNRSGKTNFSMNISDCGGNKTSIYVFGRKKPQVELLDESGKVIWTKALEYG